MWSVARRFSDLPALMSKTRNGEWASLTFTELASQFERFGAGLLDFGVKRGDHVGVISDNRKEWIFANLGIQGIGAADVPRGSDTMADEARYILHHADCALAIVENTEQLKKILSRKGDLPLLRKIIVMEEDFQTGGVPRISLRSEGGPLHGRHVQRPETPHRGPLGLCSGDGERQPGRPGNHHLHLGHDGRAQGSHADSCQLPSQHAHARPQGA